MTKLADSMDKIADIEETLRKTKNELKWVKEQVFEEIANRVQEEKVLIARRLKRGNRQD